MRWPRWLADGEPAGLVKYVQPDAVRSLMRLPGPSSEPVLDRLGQIYASFRAAGVRYAWEEASDEAGRQIIRPPGQVLSCPGHGTCLDLAVTFAGACLAAGLRPLIVLVKPPKPGPSHAVVAVWLDRRLDYPLDGVVHQVAPPVLVDELQAGLGGPPGDFVAVDVVGAAGAQPHSPTRGLGVTFEEAVANGAAYLAGGQWSWWLGIDVGNGWRAQDALVVGDLPDPPLRRPYLDPEDSPTPLQLLRADYEVVPFRGRDELTVLDDRCRSPLGRPAVGVALVHAVGGAGKTRLAAELAKGLVAEGWYGGFLRANATDAEIGWLGTVESPLVVVVDYAEARLPQLRTLFKALRPRPDQPTVVVATARSLTGWWEALAGELGSDGIPYRVVEDMGLGSEHPDPLGVFHATRRAFGGQTGASPQIDKLRGSWTTLDYVLLAWMSAQGAEELPDNRRDLYRSALTHERSYWAKTFGGDDAQRPEPHVFQAAAVCATVTRASHARVDAVLAAVPALARDGAALNRMARTMRDCLAEPDGTTALRPDPVADHLILEVLGDQGRG